MANNLSAQMPPSQLHRRTSRGSASQSGYRSSRVEKPKSNHNSPRTFERRKTTSGTKRYATLDDHFNLMFGLTGQGETEEDQRETTRPMSWHPSSSQTQGASRSSMLVVQTSGQDWSRHSAHGSDFYSLSARSPMYPEQFLNHPTYTTSHGAHRGSQASDHSWQTRQTQSYAVSAYSTPTTEPMPWYLTQWARENEAEVSSSRNGSTDFLPIQRPSSHEDDPDEDEEMEDSGKELVGMGLYDLPEPSLSWNSSSLVEGTGKGLKLEETWQPPEEDEEDEDEEDEAGAEANDASSDDGSIEELPVAKEDTILPMLDAKPQALTNLDGQSFFFDDGESYTKEWWYQQLKQPSMPVRDAGLGHGWL